MKRKIRKAKILVIHGPNLNLLGSREPDIYGKMTLEGINKQLKNLAAKNKIALTIKQSNHEGEIADLIGSAKDKYDAILLNPAAYTHTSVAIRDAVAACGVTTIEVHISNIYTREDFRQRSLISPVAIATIAGFGAKSYTLGLQALIDMMNA